MGAFDYLGSAMKVLAGSAEATLPLLLPAAISNTSMGNLQGLLEKLQQAGLGAQVSSWLGAGENQPITGDQLKAALGNEQIQQLAAHFALPIDKVLSMIAESLPAIVDQSSPNGKLQDS